MGADLHVLQVNSIFNGGGVDNQTYELSRGLVAAGVRTSLALAEGAGMTPQAQALSGLKVFPLPPRRIAFARALSRLIRRERPDVVHAQHGRDYWPTVIAAWLSGARPRVVVSRHLMGVVSGPSRNFLLRVADVVAVSRAVRSVLERTLKGPRARLHQIYGGVDCAHFQPASPEIAAVAKANNGWAADDVVFSVLGFFNPPRGKGQLEFLQAAAQVHRRHPQARFLIVGAGGLLQRMQAMIAESGLQNVCAIQPWQADVREALAGTDVLVYPVVAPEALGIALWEAMACGRPVIGSALGGVTEAFVDGRHGLHVPPDDLPALVAAMNRLAGDAPLRLSWGAAARQYVVERFSTEAQAAAMIDLYQTIRQGSR